MDKLSEVAMKVECITDPDKIVEFDRWRACLDYFEEDAEFIAESSLSIVECYYTEILVK